MPYVETTSSLKKLRTLHVSIKLSRQIHSHEFGYSSKQNYSNKLPEDTFPLIAKAARQTRKPAASAFKYYD